MHANAAALATIDPAMAGRVRLQDCKHGKFVFLPTDALIGASLERYGEYSEGEVELFARIIKPGFVVAEVGANIGALTVPIARMAGDEGRVFAYEPQRIIHQQLCANVAINGLWNVWTYNVAVGAGPSVGTLCIPPVNYAAPGNFGGVTLSEHGAEPVDVITLDGELYSPSFVKIDCEGMELEVLRGAEHKIEACRPVLYVENDRIEKSEALVAAMRGYDYDLYWHTPALFNPANWAGDSTNILGGIHSFNVLGFPKELAIKVAGLLPVTGAVHPELTRAQP